MSATPYDVIRPYAILAVVAFVLGFAGYVALGRPALAAAVDSAPPVVVVDPAASGAAEVSPTAADWNLPKKI